MITVVRYIFYRQSVILISPTVFDTNGRHYVTYNINVILFLYSLTINNNIDILSEFSECKAIIIATITHWGACVEFDYNI